ncbi:MAG: thiamine pyrophosphate-dependent enzyme [bacterium]
MNQNKFNRENIDIAWCAGCGDFSILRIMKETLFECNYTPEQVVMVSGIGQAAKMPHYMTSHVFNGLHGRALPAATGIKATNPNMLVIAESGDGDMYGEGGNHFIHTIRRNPNIVNIVHNNMVYGLTKGQASPTSSQGFKTAVQVSGVHSQPFNPLAVAISLDASFVARAFCGDVEQTKEIIKKAINHNGYALVDIFQPCVTFNKTNTYKWFKDNTYYLDENHNPHDHIAAYSKAIETEKLPLGVFYINENKVPFEDTLSVYAEEKTPLSEWQSDRKKQLASYMDRIK